MWNINFLVVLLSLVLQSQCKETVKFGIANGTVFDTSEATSTCASNLAECITKCQEDEECILADYNNETCYLHPFGHNIIVNMTTAEEGRVAFKLRTDQKACGANLPNLLKNNTYFLYGNHSEEFVYRIETLDKYYIVISEKIPMFDPECKPYFEPGEYKGGLDSDVGFVTFLAYFAVQPSQMNYAPHFIFNATTADLKGCREKCKMEDTCQAFYWDNDSCQLAVYLETPLFKKTPQLKRVVGVKIPFNNATCKMTPTQLLSNKTYPIFSKGLRPTTDPQYFTVNETPRHVGFTYTSANNTECQDYFYNKKGSCLSAMLYAQLGDQEIFSDACKAFGAKLHSPWYENAALTDKILPRWFDTEPAKSWTSIKIKPECYESKAAECEGDGKWTSEDIEFLEPGMVAKAWAEGEPNIEGLEPKNVCAQRLEGKLEGSTNIRGCDKTTRGDSSHVVCVVAPQKRPTLAEVKAEFDALK